MGTSDKTMITLCVYTMFVNILREIDFNYVYEVILTSKKVNNLNINNFYTNTFQYVK